MVVKIVDKITDWMIYIVLLLAFLLGGYAIYDSLYVYSGGSNNLVMQYKPEAEGEVMLKELSEDVVAWITLKDTLIDYPVMQGKTNSDYLNTNPYGEYSLAGSIFLDSRNSQDFSDCYNILYGHHMMTGAMFGALDAYLEKGYMKEHEKGTLTLTDGTVYMLTVFAAGTGETADEELFNPDQGISLQERIRYFARISDFYKDTAEGKVLALTTCKQTTGTKRTFVLCAMRLSDEGTD